MNQLPPPVPLAGAAQARSAVFPATNVEHNAAVRRWVAPTMAPLAWTGRWLVGAAMCFNFFVLSWITAIAAVGWTNRVVQMVVLRCWWWRSDLRHRISFSELCQSLGPQGPVPRPRWFIREKRWYDPSHLTSNGRKSGILARLGGLLYWPWHSLWLNFKIGFKATLCTYALTGLPCLLMLWSWEQGWINSFHGGYEQAWLGPAMGFFGIFFFVAMMSYVPMAQAHLATTGEARAFFDFPFVWQLVRVRLTAYVLLALAIGMASLIMHVGRNMVLSETFGGNAASTAEIGRLYFAQYLLKLSLLLFPAYALLRVFGGLVYQSAVLKALRRGLANREALHPTLKAWLDALHLETQPQLQIRGIGWVARVTARWTYRRVLFATLFVAWFAFFVRFYIGYFLVYEPYTGFLNHPLIQIPCFDFIPPHLYQGQDK